MSAAALEKEIDEVVAAVEPDAVVLSEVTSLWAAIERMQRKLAGMGTLLARRVDDAGAWRAAT